MIKNPFKIRPFLLLTLILILLVACRNKHESAGTELTPRTPVLTGSPVYADISDTTDFPAITSYLKKNILKSSIAGVIEAVSAVQGKPVVQGEPLFTIRTMESSAMKNAQLPDTSLGITGIIKILTPGDGAISSVSHQTGDLVQQGDELAVIADRKSLVFILELPFEMNTYIKLNSSCPLLLPDNTRLMGKISSKLPEMNAQNQTVKYIVTAANSSALPENLIASALIAREVRKNVLVLPKAAVLGNETLTSFWVMKLINDSVAVRVPVRKGIENGEKVEIEEPQFSLTDRILTSGNYGLPDTALVIVGK
jgi:multidrug efflux pump subunit AcrA (membrane-fusion protein)